MTAPRQRPNATERDALAGGEPRQYCLLYRQYCLVAGGQCGSEVAAHRNRLVARLSGILPLLMSPR